MTGGHVASRRHETLDFVLSVRTLEAHHRQHNMLVFLCLRTAVKIFKSLSMHSLVLLVIRKHDKVCDEVSLEQCVPIDRPSWTHAPSANAAEKIAENHVQDGGNRISQKRRKPGRMQHSSGKDRSPIPDFQLLRYRNKEAGKIRSTVLTRRVSQPTPSTS